MGKINQNICRLLVILLISLLRCYKLILSPLLGDRCRFYPSCSCYAIDAITNFGVIKGIFFTIKRLLKCHPFHPGGFDPVLVDKKQKR